MDTVQTEEVKEIILEEFLLKLSPEGGLNIEVNKTKEKYYKSAKKLLFIINSQHVIYDSVLIQCLRHIKKLLTSSKNNPKFSYWFV